MKTRRVAAATVLALAAALLSASAAQAKSSVPRPLAGHWKIEKAFSDVTSGSLIISKSRTTVRHVMFVPKTPYCGSTTTTIRVVGSFHLHNVAGAKNGANDNSPDWSITKANGTARKVTAHQGKATIHGTLSLGFGSKNGTRKPVKYLIGEFDATDCSLILGGAHHH